MAPSRGSGFDGQLFFVYDREAVTKEGDPPEDAIIYFYPPSASIESRVSICGQLVGMSNFLSTVLDFAPVLVKLRTEKVALLQSCKYTLAFGGSSTEPESLLLRQLKALFGVFAFYHGSFDNVQKFSKDHTSFLSNMTIIWDCYLPFIRYYGDTLPAVFDPLPFLKTPKTSCGSFLKASHILQACQRRRHVLGGCILYKKSVLCTQLEPCITRRLLLFKPNQSHHPAKQVETEINLPFGVRILHLFLTMHEYKRLMKELSRSPYHQYPSSQLVVSPEDNQGKEINRTVGERFHGLLHKSVRKRIESESRGVSLARENRSRAKSNKFARPRARERSFGKERSLSCASSAAKHESDQNKLGTKGLKNQLIRGVELRIDVSSKLYDALENTPKEYELEHDKHSSAVQDVNELLLGNANTDKDTDKIRVRRETPSNSQEGLEDGTSYPTCSGTHSTRNKYRSTSSSSDEEELTMDEVDLKDLIIVSYAVKDSDSCEAGRFFKIRTSEMESQETVRDICNEVVNDLIEQVVRKSDIMNLTCGMSVDCTSVLATSHAGFKSSSSYTKLCEGQSLETNLHADIPNGLDKKEPINGHVCESSETATGTMEGQHNGVLAIGTVEHGYLDGYNIGSVCDKVPVSITEAVSSWSDLGCSTNELVQHAKRKMIDSIITSGSDSEEGKITHVTSCGDPAGVTDPFLDVSVSDTDVASQRPNACTIDDSSSKDYGSPGSDYHDSLEELVTDCGKSDEKFLEESSLGLLQDHNFLKRNDFTINEYSSKNINLPKDKDFRKSFFKDLVDATKDNFGTASSTERKASDIRSGESNPEPLDFGANASLKDSRTSSELSEYDNTLIDSSTPSGCPRDCTNTLGDSGLCLVHEGSDNVSHGETEVDSNPGVHEGHHSGDDNAAELEATDSEQHGVKQTTQERGDENEGKEVDCDCQTEDDAFEVDGLVHLNLYVQAHSNTVLILLAEDQLHQDNETIKALWKTSLNELGELEVRLNQCNENLDHSVKPEDYSYLVYDGLSNTTKGNLEEPVLQADHMFCDTAKTVHEQFNNCSSLRSVTLRNTSSAVYCQRTLGQEVYYHKKGSFNSFLSSPSPRDPAFTLEKRACKLLHKDHGINVF